MGSTAITVSNNLFTHHNEVHPTRSYAVVSVHPPIMSKCLSIGHLFSSPKTLGIWRNLLDLAYICQGLVCFLPAEV
uniref:Uncharacterized protein n=1 Tax=Arundo donax TaxID=35708 RepID=A0A0A9FDP7_ARUDO